MADVVSTGQEGVRTPHGISASPDGYSRPNEPGDPRRARIRRFVIIGLVLGISAILVGLVSLEMRTSWFQSRLFSSFAERMVFSLEEHRSDQNRFPADGPYDLRFGYFELPIVVESVTRQGYDVTAQAVVSDAYAFAVDMGLFPIYATKNQSGLRILDRSEDVIYETRYPERVYERFEDIPPLVWRSLLNVENRTLLDESTPYRNPAVEWSRFARALAEQSLHAVGFTRSAPGASTLATQLEKLRHSPGGRTDSAPEKIRQMTSASLRAYGAGPNTMEARKRVALDYLNSMPLAAVDGYGEITGIADGLALWFGADFDSVNALLFAAVEGRNPEDRSKQGRAYRQVLSLLLADRRPSYYLRQSDGRAELGQMVDGYLSILERDGVVTSGLRQATLDAEVWMHTSAEAPEPRSFVQLKAANAVRAELLRRFGGGTLHDLDRLDLTVTSTFDAGVQGGVAAFLEDVRDPSRAQARGLQGYRLLGTTGTADVSIAIVIYEATDLGNEVRLEVDNFDGPFSINRGSKLELGSTAKLRTLITYLELVEELHHRYSKVSPDSLRLVRANRGDNITAWGLSFLQRNPGTELRPMLDAAMRRTYSASTGESFFTGGGRHVFNNFSGADDGRVLTVAEGLRRSVNLVYIRIMRDVVAYHLDRLPGSPARMLDDIDDPRRMEYLARFADREGLQFTSQFYRRYQGRDEADVWGTFTSSHDLSPRRLAWAFRSVVPEADSIGFRGFMTQYAGTSLSDAQLDYLYRQTDASSFNWQDRGYLANVHPLELWLMDHLEHHPDASWTDIARAGSDVRQEVYQWLFNSTGREGQNNRIRTLLEEEAFVPIHARWARLGYPFDSLVPSYATAIGSSADRPDALAELVGIVIRGGLRYPNVRVKTMHFAEETPFETVVEFAPVTPVRVLSEDLASVVRNALRDVVENGTAVRARGSMVLSDGTVLPVGGKTGTGDNRRQVFDGRGRVIASHALNRTSTFVFFIGERHFGVITVYVDGPSATRHSFTSSLPVTVLRTLGPTLQPLFESAQD